MSSLWFVPVLVLLAGAAMAWWLLAKIDRAAAELREGARRVQVLGHSLVPVRAELDRTRDAIDRLHRQ